MKRKKYWIKYVDMYSKDVPLVKEESDNFQQMYDLYTSLQDLQYTFGASAYYLHSVSKSLKDKIDDLINL